MLFYKLEAGSRFEAHFAKGTDWEGKTCSTDETHVGAGKRIPPTRVDLPSTNVPHFLSTFLSDYIITDEVRQLFEKAGFKGYILKPVIVNKVRKGNREEIPPLWEFIVIGKGGDAHPKSGIRLRYACPGCDMRDYTCFGKGLFIDESQWDGSDFFTVWPLPKFIIVTEKIKNFIKKHKLKNCKFTPTKELVGEGEDGGLGPGATPPWEEYKDDYIKMIEKIVL